MSSYLNTIIELLENKYGPIQQREGKNYFFTGQVGQTRRSLNVFFKKEEFSNNIKTLEQNKIIVSQDIKDFYSQYNGISLFCFSLVIYGYYPILEVGMTPLHSPEMNRKIRAKNRRWDNKFYSIGTYSSFEFCFKQKDNTGTIYVIDRENNNLVRTFSSLIELLNYSVSKLCAIYGNNGLIKGLPEDTINWALNICNQNIF